MHDEAPEPLQRDDQSITKAELSLHQQCIA